MTVQLDGEYESPVIFASVPASVGAQEAVARIRHIRHGGGDCTGWCFDIRLQEPSCRDDFHLAENLAWIVFEAGVYYTDEGAIFQVGTINANGGAFHDVVYHSRFPGDGVATISQVQSFNDEAFVKTRQQPGDSGGFRVALEQIGTVASHVHGEEVIGWLSIQSGTGHIGTSAFEAATTDEVITHMHGDIDWTYPFATPPRVFGSIATTNGVLTLTSSRSCWPICVVCGGHLTLSTLLFQAATLRHSDCLATPQRGRWSSTYRRRPVRMQVRGLCVFSLLRLSLTHTLSLCSLFSPCGRDSTCGGGGQLHRNHSRHRRPREQW